MNYLISAFDCVVLGENKKISKNVKYEFEFSSSGYDLICDNNFNLIPFCDGVKNLASVKYKSNNYYFLLPVSTGTEYVYCLSYNSKQIVIQLSNCLKISQYDNVAFEAFITDINIYKVKYFSLHAVCFQFRFFL